MKTCTICPLDERDEIDKLIVAGVPRRKIAAQFNVSDGAVQRHKDCIFDEMIARREVAATVRVSTISTELEEVADITKEILEQTRAKGNLGGILQCVSARMKQIELKGRIEGAFQKDRDNEVDAESARRQFEKAVQQIIDDCKRDGVVISFAEAAKRLAEAEPKAKRFL